MPRGFGLDADGLEADALDARAPTGGHEQPVAPQLAPVLELQDVLVAVAPRGAGVHPQHQLDAVAAQGLAERLAQRRGLAGQHAVGALDEHGLAAETSHDLRHLDAGRPAAQHEQAAGDGLHARRLAGAPHALELAQSGERRHDRIGAGRHDDVLRGVADAPDLDRPVPASRPVPRSRSMPRPASQRSWPASE